MGCGVWCDQGQHSERARFTAPSGRSSSAPVQAAPAHCPCLPPHTLPAFCHKSEPSLVLHTHLSHGPTDERSLISDWRAIASQQTDSIRLACKMSSFKKFDLAAKIKN